MGHPALAQIPTLEYSLRISAGPEKGSVYKIVSAQVSIGRDSENDIALTNDKKCSRKHAVISIAADGSIQIQNVSDRNKLFVDGQVTTSRPLRNGSKIQVGDTELSLHIQIKASNKNLAAPASRRPIAGKASKSASSLNPARIFLILFLLAFFTMLLTDGPSNEDTPVDLRTREDIEAEIQLTRELKQKAEEQRRQPRQGDPLTLKEARANYVKGFRDYQAGQYERAIKGFQACLALDPEHVLCQRYLLLSQRKFNELVQYHVVLGRRYRDQGQYAACSSAFRNVMAMVKDQNSDIYREAKANFDACRAQIAERF